MHLFIFYSSSLHEIRNKTENGFRRSCRAGDGAFAPARRRMIDGVVESVSQSVSRSSIRASERAENMCLVRMICTKRYAYSTCHPYSLACPSFFLCDRSVPTVLYSKYIGLYCTNWRWVFVWSVDTWGARTPGVSSDETPRCVLLQNTKRYSTVLYYCTYCTVLYRYCV